MIKALKITIKGRVQGVFFRASTKAVADQLGVKGIIKNPLQYNYTGLTKA
jgi:acylphosphatase